MAFLHPALRFDLSIYATSDSLGASIVLTVSSPITLRDTQPAPDLIDALIKAGEHATAAELLKRAGDWRLMTTEEVDAYRGRRACAL